MGDRELLELAAKAAGYEFGVINDKPKIRRDGIGTCGTWGCAKHDLHDWNPLTDDGDALRLAVKLGLQVTCSDGGPEGFSYACTSDTAILYESHDADPYAATRRVIVMAAAKVGEAL